MKKILFMAALLAVAFSCSKTPTAIIDGSVAALKDSSVVLQKLNYNRLQVVDTIKTDAQGSFNSKVELTGSAPAFYYLYSGDSRLAGMILLPGDKVTVNVNPDGSYEIAGSEESARLKEIDEAFAVAKAQMDKLAKEAEEAADQASYKAASEKMGKIYVDHKRSAIKHIFANPNSITAATILFEKFNELPVFNEMSDVIIFKQVRDSIKAVYPESEYLIALNDAIESREKLFSLSNKFSTLEVIDFPDLELPDINGEKQLLSKFGGKVIILSFWSVAQEEHKMFNNELMELYAKYHSAGLEIYQVSLDLDKPTWATVVKTQNIPWTSVNDGLGIQSPSLITYNVNHVPMMYVITRDGNIAGVDVFDKNELEKIIVSSL
jgi:Peroxiredoxin